MAAIKARREIEFVPESKLENLVQNEMGEYVNGSTLDMDRSYISGARPVETTY